MNPNLYESGKVCLSLLNTWWGNGCEKWGKSNSTMLQVLVSIQGLVLNDKPYFNEPGNKNAAKTTAGENNSLAYNQTAFVLSCKTMWYSLRKPPKVYFQLLILIVVLIWSSRKLYSRCPYPNKLCIQLCLDASLSLQHFETLVAHHFHEREDAILDACSTYMSGAVVGSSAGSGTRYACDKSFADFKKSLALYTEHLRTEFAANRSRVLELDRQASAVGEIVPTS